MKIGSMTFNESINYGSVLQAWALQKVLLDSGYTVEVIDYEPEAYHKLYGTDRRIIFGILIIRCYDVIDHTTDDFRFIMLIRKQNIWKFIMIAPTSSTFESSDTQIIPVTAFMFSDTKPGVTVSELSTTVRTSWYIFTALNKKHRLLRCG